MLFEDLFNFFGLLGEGESSEVFLIAFVYCVYIVHPDLCFYGFVFSFLFTCFKMANSFSSFGEAVVELSDVSAVVVDFLCGDGCVLGEGED